MSKVSLSHISTIPGMTPEESILYYARVSNPSGQTKNNPRLFKYLYEHEHWSPFEMISMCLHIETTRDISRQILRHRSFSFQEYSQRYARVDDLGWTKRDMRFQDNTNRQSSVLPDPECLEHFNMNLEWEALQYEVIEVTTKAYTWALDQGIAKEQARAVLPEGLIKTSLYMHGSIRSWIHYVNLRTGPETQREHREVALECQRILYEQCPSLQGIHEDLG